MWAFRCHTSWSDNVVYGKGLLLTTDQNEMCYDEIKVCSRIVNTSGRPIQENRLKSTRNFTDLSQLHSDSEIWNENLRDTQMLIGWYDSEPLQDQECKYVELEVPAVGQIP